LVAGSGIQIKLATMLAIMAGSVAAMIAACHFAKLPLYSIGGAVVLGILLPIFVLAKIRQRRFAKLTIQLPDALDTLVRSLRAGHPIPVGISMIGNQMPEPVSGEFRRVSDAMAYGLDLKDAFEQMGARLRINDVHYMIAAIRIQYATGGNLAEVLASLSSTIRERQRLTMEVKALSAETRLSGNIMSVIPFLLVGGMTLMKPDFYSDVPNNPTLQIIMGVSALLLLVGIIVMRRIVNIRV
jgi:tight adherence protein B